MTIRDFARLAIWRSQADANPILIDLKLQAAVSVIFGELTEVGIDGGVGNQALLNLVS